MSSNIDAAKAAIEAEIEHAKRGVAHFLARIETLEKTIGHLVGVDGGVLDIQRAVTATANKPAKASKVKPKKATNVTKPATATVAEEKAKRGKATKAAKPAKARKSVKVGEGLPSTRGDFWVDLLVSEPKSASEVLDAAIGKLGIAPSDTDKKKLAQRQTFALNALVKAGKIKDSGSGRARRFFKG